jgi:hypothetical protein
MKKLLVCLFIVLMVANATNAFAAQICITKNDVTDSSTLFDFTIAGVVPDEDFSLSDDGG